MFNSIRKTIASSISALGNAIAPSSINIQVPVGAKSLTYPQVPQHLKDQQETTQSYTGQFHVSHLELLGSTYLKNAVAQLGAWSCLARAFSEYERTFGNKKATPAKFESLVEEFHCWNAAIDYSRQMSDEDIMLAANKIATVRPTKGSEDTDAIIARIRKCSVAELKAQREDAAAKQSAKRSEMLTGFLAAIGHFTGSDMDPSISNSKAAAKAIQTIEWIAKQDWDPSFVAGECLLIEADLKFLESNARKEEETEQGTFVNGTLSSDGMVRNALAEPRRKFGDSSERNNVERPMNPVLNEHDHEAFLEWQAEQHKAA